MSDGFNPSYDGNGAGTVPATDRLPTMIWVSILLMMEMGPEQTQLLAEWVVTECFNPSYDGNGAGTILGVAVDGIPGQVSILLMMEMGPELCVRWRIRWKK